MLENTKYDVPINNNYDNKLNHNKTNFSTKPLNSDNSKNNYQKKINIYKLLFLILLLLNFFYIFYSIYFNTLSYQVKKLYLENNKTYTEIQKIKAYSNGRDYQEK